MGAFMNVYSLLENRLEELTTIEKMIRNNEYEKLYETYKDVLNVLLFIESREEFFDFITEQEELEQESFLLALASSRKICSCIGMYEDNVEEILQQYFQICGQSDYDLAELNENMDLLVETINKINQSTEGSKNKYMVLLDDTYCEGCFYIFYVTNDESSEDWDDKMIQRVL